MITVDNDLLLLLSASTHKPNQRFHSDVSLLLFQLCEIITKSLHILLKFYMNIKAKTFHFFYAKTLKIVLFLEELIIPCQKFR